MITPVASCKVVVCQADSKDKGTTFANLNITYSAMDRPHQGRGPAHIVVVIRYWHRPLDIYSLQPGPEQRCWRNVSPVPQSGRREAHCLCPG